MKTKVKTIKYLAGTAIFLGAFIFNISYVFASYSAGDLVTLTNSARSQNGLGALSTNSNLASAAYAKAQDIMTNGYFAHNSPTGKTPWDFINEAGYNYTYAGENLAIGYTDTSELFAAWMNSPTHRDNILNPNYREIGIAVISGKFQDAETIVVVQEFGTRDQNIVATPEPTATPSVAASANPTPEQTPIEKFNFIQDKSGISPQSIFSLEAVEITVTVSGNIKTLEAEAFEKKYNLLETASVTGLGQEKTYTLKQKIESTGSSEVKIFGVDKNGNSATLNLGILEVKEKVIVKSETQEKSSFIVGFKKSLSKNWPLYAMAISLMILAVVGYFILKKNKLNNAVSFWRF